MKSVFVCAVAAGAALLASLQTIQAQDIQFVSHAADEQECESCGCDSRSSGLEGGVDVTLLQVYANHGAGERNGGNSWFDADSTTTGNMRYWLGYRGQNGLGFRASFFSYYSQIGPAGVVSPDFFNSRLVDGEVTALVRVWNWDCTFFGGVRYGDLHWSDENGASGFNFFGAGPTLGLDVRRELFGNLGLIAGVRGSYLLGQTNELTGNDKSRHTTCNMTDLRLGVDWRRQTAYGSLIIGAAWEQQVYTGLSGNVDNDIDPEDIDVTLAGPVLRFSFAR